MIFNSPMDSLREMSLSLFQCCSGQNNHNSAKNHSSRCQIKAVVDLAVAAIVIDNKRRAIKFKVVDYSVCKIYKIS
jgi:hypothetical protein